MKTFLKITLFFFASLLGSTAFAQLGNTVRMPIHSSQTICRGDSVVLDTRNLNYQKVSYHVDTIPHKPYKEDCGIALPAPKYVYYPFKWYGEIYDSIRIEPSRYWFKKANGTVSDALVIYGNESYLLEPYTHTSYQIIKGGNGIGLALIVNIKVNAPVNLHRYQVVFKGDGIIDFHVMRAPYATSSTYTMKIALNIGYTISSSSNNIIPVDVINANSGFSPYIMQKSWRFTPYTYYEKLRQTNATGWVRADGTNFAAVAGQDYIKVPVPTSVQNTYFKRGTDTVFVHVADQLEMPKLADISLCNNTATDIFLANNFPSQAIQYFYPDTALVPAHLDLPDDNTIPPGAYIAPDGSAQIEIPIEVKKITPDILHTYMLKEVMIDHHYSSSLMFAATFTLISPSGDSIVLHNPSTTYNPSGPFVFNRVVGSSTSFQLAPLAMLDGTHVNGTWKLRVSFKNPNTDANSYYEITNARLKFQNVPYFSYTWSPNAGMPCPNCANPMVPTPSQTTAYTVTCSNPWGCSATATVNVLADTPAKPTVRTSMQPRSITFSWDTLALIDHYEIKINNGAPINVGLDTSYTVSNLNIGTTVTAQVRAVGISGVCGTGDWATAADSTYCNYTLSTGVAEHIFPCVHTSDHLYIDSLTAAPNMASYLWSNGTTGQSPNGLYLGVPQSITVTDYNGCTASNSVFAWSYWTNTPDSRFVQTCDCAILFDYDTELINIGDESIDFVWSTGETGDYIQPTASGTYTITATLNTPFVYSACPFISEFTVSLSSDPDTIVIDTSNCANPNDGLTILGTYIPNGGQAFITRYDPYGCKEVLDVRVNTYPTPPIPTDIVVSNGLLSFTMFPTARYHLSSSTINNNQWWITSVPFPVTESTYSLDVYNGGGCHIGHIVIWTGTENIEKGGIKVYPSPATDQLFIKTTETLNECKIMLYDLQGRVVMSQNMSSVSGTLELSLTDLPPSVYYLKLEHDGVYQTFPIIKNP